MKARVYEALQHGKENAIKSKELAEALGFRTVRDLQKQIERERTAGYVIISDPCGGGYYLTDDPAELARFAKTLNARARNTIKAAQSAQIALDAATGQERMEGWWK